MEHRALTLPDAAHDGAGGGAGGAGADGLGGAACNPACDATHACTEGRCLLADAQPCVTASQCASSACSPFYQDVDGDGFGTGQAVGFCTLTTPPIGYAAQTGDCCDDASNIALAKLIHPAAEFQTTSAGGICGGITWDYDCDGLIQKVFTTCSGCTAAPDCQCIVKEFPDASCGTTNAHTVCFGVNAGGDLPMQQHWQLNIHARLPIGGRTKTVTRRLTSGPGTSFR